MRTLNIGATPAEITAIQSFVAGLSGGWTNSTDAIYSAMAGATVPNPVTPAPQVPAGYTIGSLTALLSASSLATLRGYPGLADVGTAVAAQQSAVVLNHVAGVLALGFITSAEASAITAAVDATVADPTWTSTVSWLVANPITKADIETARFAPGGQG